MGSGVDGGGTTVAVQISEANPKKVRIIGGRVAPTVSRQVQAAQPARRPALHGRSRVAFPHLAPIVGRSVQFVPLGQVARLAIGAEVECAVDPADPAHRFAVDWASL